MKRFKNIYVEITNVCNLSCSFCPKTRRMASSMTTNEFDEILNKVIKYTEYIYLHVMGEPLLSPNLNAILNCSDKMNAKIKLTTNATLLKDNLSMLLTHPSIKAVNISLSCLKDFTKERAERYLNDVFYSVKYLSSNGITCTYRMWTDTPYFDIIKQKILNEYAVPLKIGIDGKQRLANHILFDIQKEFVWPIDSAKNANADSTIHKPCLGLRKQLAILSSGDVVPCCLDSDGVIKLGNIFSCTLEEILNTKAAIAIADGFAKRKSIHSFCKSCTFTKM